MPQWVVDQPLGSPPLGGFAGLYNGWAGSFQAEPGYSTHPDSELPVAFKVEDGDNFPYGASRSNPPPAPALFRGAAPSAPPRNASSSSSW